MDDVSPNEEQAEFWEDLADVWLASQRHVIQVGSQFGSMAMDRLGLEPGARVLDIGCGAGHTTVELARRVGPDGRVVGVDIAPSMVAAATAVASGASVGNVEFRVADMEVAPLEEHSYDATFSQFGVMFFADPVRAFSNVRRCLSSGVFAFSGWKDIFANEWMLIPGAVFIEVTGVTPSFPADDQPGPFSLSDAARVEQLLVSAGFGDVDIVSHDTVIALPEEDIDSLVRLGARTGPVRDFMKEADEPTRERVLREVRAKLDERVEGGTLRLSAGALLVRAVG